MRLMAPILLLTAAASAADPDRDRALGRQLAAEVERQAKMLADPMVGEYINRIGQTLVKQADTRWPFVFKVIDADQLNAFAFPGGFVFVNTGLIKMCSEESELAAALAHEVAHVTARHMALQARRARTARLIGAPVGVLFGGLAGSAAREASRAGLASFARHDETQADRMGLHYLYDAGYDPVASISLFEKLESARRGQPGIVSRMFATHPSDGTRLETVRREIQQALPPRNDYIVTTSAYAEVRQRLFNPVQQRPVD
jgi:predicted Zn-dependent protease